MNICEKGLRVLGVGLAAVMAVSLWSGCALMRRSAAKAMAPLAEQLTAGLMREDDLTLVREGAPSFLLVLDALAEAHPENPAVLYAAADAQLAYATAFVASENPARTKLMYGKARRYSLRALSCKSPKFAKALEGHSQEAFERSLETFKAKDAAMLFTAASSWVFWIMANSDSPAAVGGLPRVLAMIRKTQELDSNIRNGGPDLFYGIYYTVLPPGGGRDLEKARAHFERSMEIAGPDYLLARVTFAEFYARYAFDQELFEKTLRDVLAAEPKRPEFTMMNQAAQQRAKRLLEKTEDLF